MPSHKIKTEDSTTSGAYEARVFSAHATVRVAADQTKPTTTTASSSSANVGPQSVGSATVPTNNSGISVMVNVDPGNSRNLLSAANRVLAGESARKGPDPESR